jgi:hypothetical protein
MDQTVAGSNANGVITITDLILIIVRRWKLFVVVFILGLLGTGYLITLPPKYAYNMMIQPGYYIQDGKKQVFQDATQIVSQINDFYLPQILLQAAPELQKVLMTAQLSVISSNNATDSTDDTIIMSYKANPALGVQVGKIVVNQVLPMIQKGEEASLNVLKKNLMEQIDLLNSNIASTQEMIANVNKQIAVAANDPGASTVAVQLYVGLQGQLQQQQSQLRSYQQQLMNVVLTTVASQSRSFEPASLSPSVKLVVGLLISLVVAGLAVGITEFVVNIRAVLKAQNRG